MIIDILLIIIGAIIILAIVLPWISLYSLNGIHDELRKIRQTLERYKGE